MGSSTPPPKKAYKASVFGSVWLHKSPVGVSAAGSVPAGGGQPAVLMSPRGPGEGG